MILDALETSEVVILQELLPEDYKHAHLSALYRAAKKLEQTGRLHVVSREIAWRKRRTAVQTNDAFERGLREFKAKYGKYL
jgi:hypothetical protein